MPRDCRAASTTWLVTDGSPFDSRIGSICVRRRFSSRKLPPVIQLVEAAVAESNCSKGSLTAVSVQWCASITIDTH